MANRLKILLSAYSCEPNRGSEQEVGWQWGLQMARFHDVTVVTRANNRPPIETWLKTYSGPRPTFVYHDLGAPWLRAKRIFRQHQIYYHFWQRSLPGVIRRLQRQQSFDLMHHVTFASFRHRVGLAGLGVPWIWGPVGGIESIPIRLLPFQHWGELPGELVRNLANTAARVAGFALQRRSRAAQAVLAATPEMQLVLDRLGARTQLMPTIGLDVPAPLPQREARSLGPLRALYVGRLVYWKGISLAIKAVAAGPKDVTLTIVGSGPFAGAAHRLVEGLNLAPRVRFLGQKHRDQVIELYQQFDLLLYPSLHDSGGYVVIEAMLGGLPVICLDCGGPGFAVAQDCGFKIKPGPQRQVVAELAQALQTYATNGELLQRHGRAGQAFVAREFDWKVKAARMDEIYQRAFVASRKLAVAPGG